MQPFAQISRLALRRIRWVLTDVDDTLTVGAGLPAATYRAIEQLREAGYPVIPITAASAGWCDLMCRMWPIAAVIGENGGLCFRYDRGPGTTERRYWASDGERCRDRARLDQIAERIRAQMPEALLSDDQRWREVTLGFRNTGEPAADRIAAQFASAGGGRTTINSMWVLGWFGGFDKLAMTRRMMAELFSVDIESDREMFIYVGDSINDEPMFGFFPNSVGVATVRDHSKRMSTLPRWVTKGGGGSGFVEIAEALLRSD